MRQIPDMLYVLVNGTYACENDAVMNGMLKGELGFQGCKHILHVHGLPLTRMLLRCDVR